jgi:hypothetical protein
MKNEDHEHWANDSPMWQAYGSAAPGYDANNGLHSHTYHPSHNVLQQASHTQPPVYQAYPAAGSLEPQYYAQGSHYMTYPTGHYLPVAPAWPQQSAVYVTGYHAVSTPQSNVYYGRTKAQVDEDNMKLAAREGANDPRKIQPVGVKDSQYFWVRQAGHDDDLW